MFKTVREKEEGCNVLERNRAREWEKTEATKIGQDAGRKVKKERRER